MHNLLKKFLQKWVYFMDFVQQYNFIVKFKYYILSDSELKNIPNF